MWDSMAAYNSASPGYRQSVIYAERGSVAAPGNLDQYNTVNW